MVLICNMSDGPIKKFARHKPKKAMARKTRLGATPTYIPTNVALITWKTAEIANI
jgi:hypothetical protein